MSAARRVLDMELVYIGHLDDATFTFMRVLGDPWPGIVEGARGPRADSLCAQLLAGAPAATADAATDRWYGVSAAAQLGVTSYVGVPIRDRDGRVVGTLCGVDHRSVCTPSATVETLRTLAEVVAHVVTGDGRLAIVRTATGWRVADEDADDLTAAMTLADLLAGELPPRNRPPRPRDSQDEYAALRLSVSQLQHALLARVVVEQAIGVLAERHRLAPRTAFERLRQAARSRGRRVHDLARELVASADDGAVPLPPELARPSVSRLGQPVDPLH
jgi:hypothetical protein